jgi:hypothetical protein
MTPKQEEALRDYLQEVIVPLIEEVLVKKLGQAMTFAKEELAQPAIPDAIHHTDTSESLEYIQGWNDCRAEMLKGRHEPV